MAGYLASQGYIHSPLEFYFLLWIAVCLGLQYILEILERDRGCFANLVGLAVWISVLFAGAMLMWFFGEVLWAAI